ncbi:MAG: tetratricopeptide repeat protein [Spirochaetota bacterium]
MRLKSLILIVIIAGLSLSYFKADQVYRYYLTVYYQKIEKLDEAAFTARIENFYKEKNYTMLKRYCDHGNILYPANKKIKKYNGLYLLSMGDVKGAFILIALDEIPDDIEKLEKIITVLDDNASYKEVIMIVSKKGAKSVLIQYKYGKALYFTGSFKQALNLLQQVYARGIHESDFFIGECYFTLNDYKNALVWYKKALQRQPQNKQYIHRIAAVYKQLGDYPKATQYIMRLQQ